MKEVESPRSREHFLGNDRHSRRGSCRESDVRRRSEVRPAARSTPSSVAIVRSFAWVLWLVDAAARGPKRRARHLADGGPSPTRRGNCRDNAAAESFLASLKEERAQKRTYRTRDDARSDLFSQIEVFYNSR